MFRFHKAHGRNIELQNDGITAVRTQSFANALIFSNRPLEINEIFLFEIKAHEKGWAGNIRCGVTLHNPARINVPQYLLPDLFQLGKSFVFAIKPVRNDPFNDSESGREEIRRMQMKEEEEEIEEGNKGRQNYSKHLENVITKCDNVSSSIEMEHEILVQNPTCNPCDIDSRIGFFISEKRDFYILINGEQYGPCARNIPKHCNIYAALDLYGMTKEVKIINCCVPKLSLYCKNVIWKLYKENDIENANIPRTLKNEILCLYQG